MPAYLDTSALLRAAEERGDLAAVHSALRDHPITSSLARLECWASVHKRHLDGEIDLRTRDQLLDRCDDLLQNVEVVALNQEVLSAAFSVTAAHPLRTLDGLHLASAMLTQRLVERRGHRIRFCTADRRQAAAAAREFGESNVDLVPPWR